MREDEEPEVRGQKETDGRGTAASLG